MKPIDLSDPSVATKEIRTKVCVIGAGVAGLVAARRIAMAGIDVVLLESGGAGMDARTVEYNRVEDVFGAYGGALNGRFRGMGGSSMQWGGRLLPLQPTDVLPRSYVDTPGWPIAFDELNRYEREINALFSVDTSTYEEPVLDQFATRGPLPSNDPSIQIRLPKWVAFSRCNLGRLLKDEVEQLPHLSIWLNTTVCDFVLSADRLTTVTARDVAGKQLRVSADEFLIAGGTLESTRLLLLLDRASDDRLFAGCRALGRYFQDHIGCGVADLVYRDRGATNRALGYRFIHGVRRSLHFDLNAQTQQRERVAGGFAHVTMVPTENSSTALVKRFLRGLQVGKLAVKPRDAWRIVTSSGDLLRGVSARYAGKLHYWPADLKHQLNIWIEQLPHFENRLSLSDQADVFGIPKLRIEWKKMDVDEKTFRTSLQYFRDYWERHELNQYFDLAWRKELAEPGVRMTELANDLLHPSGSTRMGIDPADSVVDPHLRVHAMANVSVASASAFPSSGAANPTYTILQLAFRAADALIARSRSAVAAIT